MTVPYFPQQLTARGGLFPHFVTLPAHLTPVILVRIVVDRVTSKPPGL